MGTKHQRRTDACANNHKQEVVSRRIIAFCGFIVYRIYLSGQGLSCHQTCAWRSLRPDHPISRLRHSCALRVGVGQARGCRMGHAFVTLLYFGYLLIQLAVVAFAVSPYSACGRDKTTREMLQ